MKTPLRISLLTLSLFCASQTMAADIDSLNALAQSEFDSFTKDLTAALSYKAVSPAEPLGITGFDVGLELSVTHMKHDDLWQKAAGSDISYLPIPRLHAHKGLPFGFDVGATYTAVPDSNIRFFGLEAKYAILEGTMVTPAVAVRGTYTQLQGVSQLDFNTKGLELTVSKGLLNFTPYGGIGRIWSDADPHVAPLTSVSNQATKLFAGLNFNLLLGNVAVEWDRTGSNDTLSAKLGLRW